MDQAVTLSAPGAADALASPVVELRQYTLHPGRRDTLMDLFERYFVDGQRNAGIRLHGEFRDANDPDRFVWLRGFESMTDRPRALQAFYHGDAWKAHREAANATMVDSDNVLLLRPAAKEGFSLARRTGALMVATIYLLRAPVDDGFVQFFSDQVAPVMRATGAPPLAELRTLEAPNNFPPLPVREGEHAFVWLAGYGSPAEYERHLVRLAQSKPWSAAQGRLASRLESPPVVLVLQPTPGTLARNAMGYEYRLDRTGSLHDFDFLAGSWTGTSRRLAHRGVGSADWESFPLESRMQPLLGGLVNAEEVSFPTRGTSGVTLRTFDTAKKQWAIYWVNSRDGVLQPPVFGGFDGDVGLFYGEDVDAGRPVKAAFRWTRMGPNAARWEQAFSYDGGKTWETNWVMEFERSAP
ncbi:MAG TPA: NIPSNAP family protein [Usitatibacter sp.]|jgi:hypothetical protein|nr:NIPSNAP family protein [Usitatibacter sp.]